jgi:hypothetical protein
MGGSNDHERTVFQSLSSMRSCVAGKSHRCKELISREACVRGVNIEAMLLVLRIFASPVSVSLPNAADTHDRPALLFCLNVRPIIADMPPLRANPSPYIRLPTGTPHPARAYTGMLGRFQLGIIGVAGMHIAPATPCDNGNKFPAVRSWTTSRFFQHFMTYNLHAVWSFG